MKSYKQLKKELLRDRETKRYYKDIGPDFALIETVIQSRLDKGLTQEALAKKVGTKQSAIARFESGGCNPTVSFLKKIATAINRDLKIEFVK